MRRRYVAILAILVLPVLVPLPLHFVSFVAVGLYGGAAAVSLADAVWRPFLLLIGVDFLSVNLLGVCAPYGVSPFLAAAWVPLCAAVAYRWRVQTSLAAGLVLSGALALAFTVVHWIFVVVFHVMPRFNSPNGELRPQVLAALVLAIASGFWFALLWLLGGRPRLPEGRNSSTTALVGRSSPNAE